MGRHADGAEACSLPRTAGSMAVSDESVPMKYEIMLIMCKPLSIVSGTGTVADGFKHA